MKNDLHVIEVTRRLLRMNTVNPPGNEGPAAEYVAGLLEKYGFHIRLHPFGENRLHLIAEKDVHPGQPALVLSGHLDTVPLGEESWNSDPFAGEIKDDRIFGRGSSDMKGGLAAMIVAAVKATAVASSPGVRLIFTAGEELGCQGAVQLAATYPEPGEAGGIVIGEPTANIPAIGHKGALYIRAVAKGETAHSSMPDKGINAIYKVARGIVALEKMEFNAKEDPLLGFPTLNVGTIRGGMNLNSVPDHAEFSIDVRSTREPNHQQIMGLLRETLGSGIILEKLVDLGSISTPVTDPFVQTVYSVCSNHGIAVGDQGRALPYLTDGSVLGKLYEGSPVVILGPGQPEMAHKTDEYCHISKIMQAEEIYQQIIVNWRNES